MKIQYVIYLIWVFYWTSKSAISLEQGVGFFSPKIHDVFQAWVQAWMYILVGSRGAGWIHKTHQNNNHLQIVHEIISHYDLFLFSYIFLFVEHGSDFFTYVLQGCSTGTGVPQCALLCCGYAIVHNEFTWSIYPYSPGLLCWHWGNR